MVEAASLSRKEPAIGMGLCLSGGGYRAMVFHLGVLLRLNEAALLPRLSRISSVSGGSITAACLGLRWFELDFDDAGVARNLDVVVDAVRGLAVRTIDVGSVLGGLVLPGSISDRVARAYAKHLFGGATLRDLPEPSAGRAPLFVINATNVQTGVLWRFTRLHMGDYRVGLVRDPKVPLAVAVAASSSFPPYLSPTELTVAEAYDPNVEAEFVSDEFRRKVVLSDGGVYDNLGLEPVFKSLGTVLVSDAGMKIPAEAKTARDWVRHAVRVCEITDDQVRSLRKRALIAAYKGGQRTGAYWSIRTDFAAYHLADDPLDCAGRDPRPLATLPTRLAALSADQQARLINWGYAVSDAALRRHFGPQEQALHGVMVQPPKGFPCPAGY